MNRGTSSHQNEMLPFYVSVNNVNAQICTFHVTFTLNVYELAFMSDSEPDVSMFSSLSVDTNWYFQVKHDVFLTGWFLCLSVCNRSGEQLCVCGFRNVDYQDIFQLSGLVPYHVDAKTVNPRYCCSLTVGVSDTADPTRPAEIRLMGHWMITAINRKKIEFTTVLNLFPHIVCFILLLKYFPIQLIALLP